MIFWFAAGSVFLVWNVFQSPGLDMRAVAVGALLPVVLDAPFAEQAYAHALLAPIVVLTVVMLSTMGRGHRLLRRRLLGIPIGWFCGLVLAGSWAHREVFWWPLFGAGRAHVALFPPIGVVLVEELIGILAALWCYYRFGLGDRKRREQFLRYGRVSVVSS
jgi:fumarate reductase subunit D